MSLETVSEIVWKKCLNLKSGEKALVVTDKNPESERQEIGKVLKDVGSKITECKMVQMKEINVNNHL